LEQSTAVDDGNINTGGYLPIENANEIMNFGNILGIQIGCEQPSGFEMWAFLP
jgi:hypothetical protein